ncbi:MAG: hypothetical protein ACJ77M_20255 [Thermoleophilaceae bacterium]
MRAAPSESSDSSASAWVRVELSRTTGLPNANGDVGNWTERLGLASLFVEGCLLALSAYKVATLGRVVVQVRRLDARQQRPQRSRQEIAAY